MPRILEETKPLLFEVEKALGVGAVDIEALYLGKFAQRHKDLKIAALFIISDETLGENTIEDSNAHRGRDRRHGDQTGGASLPENS